ncbi:hypothetical protein Ct9H90mP29_10010 [bacterium]|nr:MAG: hypothetical protein Ct9H90mP29_10010 [bacterium]
MQENPYFISCAGLKGDGQVSIKNRFNIGMDNLENEKYLKAQTDFKNVLLRGTGSDLGDDAQYYLGEAFFRNKEYLLAIAEYEKLTRRMGFSPFVEDARFKIWKPIPSSLQNIIMIKNILKRHWKDIKNS